MIIKKQNQKLKQKKIIRVKKKCMFCKEKLTINFKNLDTLLRFINVKGRITSRRVNGNCAKHQRRISREVKRARFLALLPYVAK